MIAAFGLAMITGIFGLIACLPGNAALSPLLFLGLAWAAGLAISGFISFWGLILIGQFSPGLFLAAQMIITGVFWVISIHRFRQKTLWLPRPLKPSITLIACGVLWILAGGAFYFISQSHPFGEWDAWAIWNLKSKFILTAADRWSWIFDRLSWHTHPDYPLALPLMNSWIAAINGGSLHPVPQMIAWAFSLLTGVMVYAGLSHSGSRKAAFFASALICTHPYYSFLATSQYADIILAFYLLCAAIVSIHTLQSPSFRGCLLNGLFIGQLSFIKNEGLIMSLLWFFLMVVFMLKSKPPRLARFIFGLTLGAIITASQTIHLKIFLASTGGDILSSLSATTFSGSVLANRINILATGLWKEYSDKQWIFIWIFISALFLTGGKQWIRKENLLPGLFLLLYSLVVINTYLWTQHDVNLVWWMNYSLNRVCLTVLPLALYTGFQLHWGTKSRLALNEQNHDN
jgi:hypothetical protein